MPGHLLRRYLYGGLRRSRWLRAAPTTTSTTTRSAPSRISPPPAGSSEWTYTYEPFGTTKSETQNDPYAPDNPMKFAGEMSDPSGLIYLRARQYDPQTGRMLTVDPAIQSVGTRAMSTYPYTADAPTVMIDPSGATFHPVGIGTSAAFSATSPTVISLFSAKPCGGRCESDTTGTRRQLQAIPLEDSGAIIGGSGAAALATLWCYQHPSCSGWGIRAWNLAHGWLQTSGPTDGDDEMKVSDILPKLQGGKAREIPGEVREADPTLGEIRDAARKPGGKVINGRLIPQRSAQKAKKILTDHRFRKSK